MNPHLITTLIYLALEATNAGIKIADILARVDEDGNLSPEEKERVKTWLKTEFAHAEEFWGDPASPVEPTKE